MAHQQWAKQYTEMDGSPYRVRCSASEAKAHKPDGHRADGSPYWNYTLVTRSVSEWEEVSD